MYAVVRDGCYVHSQREIRARPVSALGRIGNHMAAMVPERVQFSDMEPEQCLSCLLPCIGPPS